MIKKIFFNFPDNHPQQFLLQLSNSASREKIHFYAELAKLLCRLAQSSQLLACLREASKRQAHKDS